MKPRESDPPQCTGAQMRSRARHSRLGWLSVLLALLITLGGSTARAQTPVGVPVGVYYVGLEDTIAEAINLAEPYIVQVDQPELAQVLVLNDFLPRQEETLQLFSAMAQRSDIGLVIFCGPQFPQSVDDLSALLGVSTFGMAQFRNALAVQSGDQIDALQNAIAWNAAPPIQARTVISNPNLLRPLIITSAREPVIQRVRGRERAQTFIVGGWLAHPSNLEWQSWPYFRYLVYRLILEAANAPRILAFANYPLSPVPQGRVQWGIIGGGLVVMFLAGWALYLARRRLFMHPELWDMILITSRQKTQTLTSSETSGLPKTLTLPSSEDWEHVGFHRPLGGLLTLLLPYFLLLLPVAAYQGDLLPRELIPWTQTLSTWEITGLGLSVLGLLLDMGIGVAAVYYFATLRIRHPQEAFRYFQYYMWWQMLSGAVQFGLAALVATLILPSTAQAHLAFFLVAHALIQFPGFFQCFRFFFRAVQRLDYDQYLALVLLGGMILIQSWTVQLLREWGAAQPALGESMGGMLGLGLGLYLAELAVFMIGVGLYKHLGYSLRALFLPTFDRHITGRMASFGGRLAFGAAFVPLGAVAQTVLLPRLIPTYSTLHNSWTLAVAFAAVYDVLSISLYNGLLPAIAEVHIQGYERLLRYYISQSVHYGLWFSLFLFTALYAVGDRVILGTMGTSATEVVHWLLPILLWGSFQWLAWSANQILIALGRPATVSWLTIGEQMVRVGLLAVLAPPYRMMGLPIAFAGALMLRGLVGWWFVGRATGRTRVYVWQTFIAPIGAAAALYAFLGIVEEWMWTPTISASVMLLLVGLTAGLAVYGFLTALLGGWDSGGIAELARATRLSGLGWPLAWLLTTAVRLGAQLSPLHGRFPTTLREFAEEEARAATLGMREFPSTTGE
ncbi:MAG: polysaccharide biosynthesis C-terminal domain-containing protein [Anaerolineae bacterium]|nr:polysaccharide biosynthesis C-terminal domain-containing protein [Anaerolineae bacterium]